MPRAVRQPNLREIVEVARTMGLDPQPTEKAARPIMPWEKAGFIEIKKTGPKIQTLKVMAAEIAKLRQRQMEQQQAQMSSKRR